MADEPVEVQVSRIRWDGYKSIAQTVGNVLLALIVAIQAIYTGSKVERVASQAEATAQKVDDLKANARMVYYAPPPDAKGKDGP